jgi:hypothetical protein
VLPVLREALMLLRDAERLVHAAGGRVTRPRRTGEVLFEWREYRVRVNGRRKDVPRHLHPLLRALQKEGRCE